MQTAKRRGRPARYAHHQDLLDSLKPGASKRPSYINGIGVFRGAKATTAWVKITLRKGALLKGKRYEPGQSKEFNLGRLSSWSWEELEAERDRLQRRADRGEALEDAPEVTFDIQAADWLSLKEKTSGYLIAAGIVSKHLRPAFGNRGLNQISVADVDRWVAAQLKTHKPASVQRQLGTLKAILNNAVKLGLIDRNPADAAEPIRGIEPRQRYLVTEEWQAALDAAEAIEAEQETRERYPNHELRGWLRSYLVWALHSGMRRGEILNLTVSDIQAAPNGRLFAHVRKSKSGKPRQVTCTDDMLAVVGRLKALPRAPGDDRLFPVSLTTVKRKLAKVWATAGLKDVRLHDFRRTHATELVHAGVDLWGVANRLGHRDLKMLERVYAVPLNEQHVADNAQRLFSLEKGTENA